MKNDSEGSFWEWVDKAELHKVDEPQETHEELVQHALFLWLTRQNMCYRVSDKDPGQARVQLLERFCGVYDEKVLQKARESSVVKDWGLNEEQLSLYTRESQRFSMESYLKSLTTDELKRII